MKTQRIVPQLWLGKDVDAEELVNFYAHVFPDTKLLSKFGLPESNVINNEGRITVEFEDKCTTQVTFSIRGYVMAGLASSVNIEKNPSISFLVHFKPDEETLLDDAYNKLMVDGEALMALDKYPFAPKYAWVKDKYGFTWQLFLMEDDVPGRDLVIPTLTFTGEVLGEAVEAMNFYSEVFRDSNTPEVYHYPEGMPPNETTHVMHGEVILENFIFSVQDSAIVHDFEFNESISFIVLCDNQEENDYYFNALTAQPEAEQCGWVKDKFGVSWNVEPRVLQTMLHDGTREQVEAVVKAFMPMKQLIEAPLIKAYTENK